MKKFTLLFAVLMLAYPAFAENNEGSLEGNHLIKNNKQCLFEGKRYSNGALLMSGGVYLNCKDSNWSQTGPANCYYMGQLYSHTAVIQNPAGGTKYCHAGDWRLGNPG